MPVKKKTTKKATAKKKPAAKKTTAKKSATKKSTTKKKTTTKAKAKKSAVKKKTKRKPNAAFMKPLTPDEALSEVVGSKPIPRTEITKKLWAYIKKNKLQNDKNRRMIDADAKLKPVFGGKSQVSMFEMTKHVAKHVS